jgi:glycosyltransferase involved in cell wall biosynthesis
MRNTEVSRMEQKVVYYSESIRLQKKRQPILRVFVTFFHPSISITAMGGAEKRFVETMKTFCGENDLEITVLESAPSLLAGPKTTCKKFLLSPCFSGKSWLGSYIEWILWVLRALFRSFCLVRHVKPDVIFVPNNTLPNLISGYVIHLIFQRPMCVVVHHVDTSFFKKEYSLYKCYRKIRYGRVVSLAKTLAFYITLPLLKRAKAIIAVSNFTAKVLMDNHVSGSKISISGNALDLNYIKAIGPCYKKRVFDGVFVGRIAKEKGIFDLMRVWRKVVKVRNNARLLIIGSGMELASVKKEIGNLNLENNVFIRGRCGDAELYSLLKSSKILIFPSLFEGWGIAVAEALACGLPIIAYNVPALKEVFGKCKGVFLVPVKDVESMASSVLKILDADENEFRKLSRYSRVYPRQFSWKKIAKTDLKCLRMFKNA